ncbi:YifB family Mg chelatase-like AAA ATPase [Zhihengliuella sp.]|uniref:YifB family Mg chelatase-like AAA ATPase n=1 Tax=Zhihengliuella sp. TaxID=1954483 RepID=UPI00281127D7|nr:YifB family Mg chelatase-like AAA ATPase [Zhihengliuella sp.]
MSALGRALGITLTGLQGDVVEVEADIGGGLPAFVLLGLPDAALAESRDRIRSAARNTGLPLSPRRITVNLLPAALPKRGSGLDLAILVAALSADGAIPVVPDAAFIGELGLDGTIRPVAGVLPAVLAAAAHGIRRVVVPGANLHEARLVPGVDVRAFEHAGELLAHLGVDTSLLVRHGAGHGAVASGSARHDPSTGSDGSTGKDAARRAAARDSSRPDFADVRGQGLARYALEVAAAGGHHVLLSGEPGAGKTMLAERLPGILPDLDDAQALEVTAIHSLHGRGAISALMRRPPLEAPHHNTTMAALIGGGSGVPHPGAASRAHRGVLFLDEAPEFPAKVLDALRQPLEAGELTLHRSGGAATYPARFQLVLAANLCPCGRTGSPGHDCECTALARRRYLSRLSGPLLDRIDLQINVPRVPPTQLTSGPTPESSADIAARVAAARCRQAQRLERYGLSHNGEIPGRLLRTELAPQPRETAQINRAAEHGWLSARGIDRVLRIGWTIADLRGAERPAKADFDIALQLRQHREASA